MEENGGADRRALKAVGYLHAAYDWQMAGGRGLWLPDARVGGPWLSRQRE